ncbi:MAG: M15 family metallopeptidase [Clostridia bacterium]|nr:M15 family metallopeptidase [Clostridia bacterium]
MRCKRLLCGILAALTLSGGLPQASALTGLSPWASEAALAAEVGLEPGALTWAPAQEPVTRAEFAAISLTLFESLAGYTLARTDSVWFTDCTDPAVNTAYEQGLVSGGGDGTFSPDKTIARQDLCVMLRNVLTQIGADTAGNMSMLSDYADSGSVSHYARESVALMLENGILVGSGGKLDPKSTASREQALIFAYRMFSDYRLYFDAPATGDAYGAIVIPSFEDTSHAGLTYDTVEPDVTDEPSVPAFSPVIVIPLNPDNGLSPVYEEDRAEEEEAPVREEKEDEKDENRSDWDELADELSAMSDAEKKLFVFGEDEPYEDQETARENQETITFPVWRLKSDGKKVESTATITVHAALADVVVQIFTEIFEGDEQFPIANVGAFAWRSNTRSEHRQGTAIDINWESNMEATIEEDGSLTITSGTHWDPEEDPLSIPADGDVVRAFKKYGFAWGGDEWTSKVDYMHFSFFGH